MKVSVSQSNYIPWKGYFDMINMVDVFVLYDTVQFTKNDWRNRNRIKTPQGCQWLSIPVGQNIRRSIQDVEIQSNLWCEKHLKTIRQNYSKADAFKKYEDELESLFQECAEKKLSEVNYLFIKQICSWLGIDTRLRWSNEFEISSEDKTGRVFQICTQLGATEYVTGPAAKSYMQEDVFQDAGITLTYMDYAGYPEYKQLYPPFDHYVTVLDLLFNEGPAAPQFLKSFV